MELLKKKKERENKVLHLNDMFFIEEPISDLDTQHTGHTKKMIRKNEKSDIKKKITWDFHQHFQKNVPSPSSYSRSSFDR